MGVVELAKSSSVPHDGSNESEEEEDNDKRSLRTLIMQLSEEELKEMTERWSLRPNMNLKKIRRNLLDEERRRDEQRRLRMVREYDDKKASESKDTYEPIARYDGQPKCSFCGKYGHMDEVCWALHPEHAPEWLQKSSNWEKRCELKTRWKEAEQRSRELSSEGDANKVLESEKTVDIMKMIESQFLCNFCGKSGHTDDICWLLMGEKKRDLREKWQAADNEVKRAILRDKASRVIPMNRLKGCPNFPDIDIEKAEAKTASQKERKSKKQENKEKNQLRKQNRKQISATRLDDLDEPVKPKVKWEPRIQFRGVDVPKPGTTGSKR